MTALDSWISPRHLDEAAIQGHRATFERPPLRMLVIREFLNPKVAERASEFLADEGAYTRHFGLTSGYGSVPEATWHAATPEERFYRYALLTGVRPGYERSPNFATYLALQRALETEQTRAYFERLVGLPLGPVTLSARRMARGDFLATHNDNIRGRQISFVMYLSRDWRREYGGSLWMTEGGLEDETVPEFNSMVVFAVDNTHHIAPIEDAAGERSRISLGGWFMAAGARRRRPLP